MSFLELPRFADLVNHSISSRTALRRRTVQVPICTFDDSILRTAAIMKRSAKRLQYAVLTLRYQFEERAAARMYDATIAVISVS
jgi:hypothetical protein